MNFENAAANATDENNLIQRRFHDRMKIKAAMSVDSVSKRPKKRDFARLY
jgi:hypothetical protein